MLGEMRIPLLLLVAFLTWRAPLFAACPGDCNADGALTAADLTRLVALILRCDGEPMGCTAVPRACAAGDLNGNTRLEVGDLLIAIDAILTFANGCPPTPTAAVTQTPTPTASSTFTPLPTYTSEATPTPTVQPTSTQTPSPTSPEATATPSTTPTATPTFTVAPAVCGNGVVEPPETCDDGNAITSPPNDTCPADCTIVTCSPSGERVEVSVQFASPRGLASVAVLVEYPDGTVQIPGTGDDSSVGARVLSRPSGFLTTVFDFDYALRVGLAGTRAISGTQLFRIQFDRCRDATAPPASAYRCRVLEANDVSFQPVAGVTCSVALP
ncbi:MAG: hypothetical protein N3C12_04690 [Candidatus Binatia bacterium]|nr:hypothetical protein [Candidatus Binatia bacterium]